MTAEKIKEIGKLCYAPDNDKISPVTREEFYPSVKATGEYYLPTNYDCFVAGYRAAMEEYASSRSGVRWVRASERLPEKRQIVIVKLITDNGIVIHGDGYVDDFNNKVCWFLGDHQTNFPVKLTTSVAEWLDESPSERSGQMKEALGDEWLRASERIVNPELTKIMKWEDGDTEWQGNIIMELCELKPEYYRKLLYKHLPIKNKTV